MSPAPFFFTKLFVLLQAGKNPHPCVIAVNNLTICGECNQRYAGLRASVWSTGLAAGPDNVLYGSVSLSEVSERTLPDELGGFPSAPRGAWGWTGIAPAQVPPKEPK